MGRGRAHLPPRAYIPLGGQILRKVTIFYNTAIHPVFQVLIYLGGAPLRVEPTLSAFVAYDYRGVHYLTSHNRYHLCSVQTAKFAYTADGRRHGVNWGPVPVPV